MVERRLLTKEFVRAAKPPARGECWIADTKQRGFGLRLWATPSGIGKAFGLRVTDKNGRNVRKTFDSRNAFVRVSDRWRRVPDYDLSDSLVRARSWARDEIDIARGHLTLGEDQQRRREHVARRLKRLTLEHAVQKMICGMRVEGRSQAYVDRLDKLFAVHIPKRLKRSPLNKVSPKALARSLAAIASQGGNLRILRSFIGQVYERAADFDGSLHIFSEELSAQFWRKWQSASKLPFPEITKLKRADYDRIFARLEAEDDRWQQALCIRLFFMLGAPMSRLMRAQWWQIIDDKWFPYSPEEKVYWFESREHLKEDAKRVLAIVRDRAKGSPAQSPYWFPSSATPSMPICTVKGFWRDTLDSVGSRYYPLGEFAQNFRPPNNPSYAMTVVRQYGEYSRETHNAAEVSKELKRREKDNVYSNG